MISDIIAQAIIDGGIPYENVYSEKYEGLKAGETAVLVKTTFTNHDSDIDGIRDSNVQILIEGPEITQSVAAMETIIEIIRQMQGQYSSTYIYNATVLNGPIRVSERKISANFKLNYRKD